MQVGNGPHLHFRSPLPGQAVHPVGGPLPLGQHRLHPPPPRLRQRQLPQQPGENTHGDGYQAEQIGESHQRAGGHQALIHPPRPHPHHRQHPQSGQRLHHRVEHRPQPAHVHHPVAQVVRQHPEPGNFGVFPSQGFHHQGGVERLVGHLRHFRPQTLGAGGRHRHLPLVKQVVGHNRRAHRQPHQGQKRVGDQQ